MVRVVRDQITNEGDHVGLEVRDFAGGIVERPNEETVDGGGAGFERSLDLGSHGSIRRELRGRRAGFVGGRKPYEADVVHVSGDVGDAATFAGGGWGLPGSVGDVTEEKLVGLFVDSESLEEQFAEVDSGGLGSGGWDWSHVASPDGKGSLAG
jgi:hypothetical protein